MIQRKTDQSIEQRALVDAAKSTLDDSAGRIDSATLTRLHAIRREAAAQATSRQQVHLRPTWLVPLGSFASIAVVFAVTVALWSPQPAFDATPIAMLEDINLLSGTEEIEFYEELEFYEWLAIEANTVG